MMRKDINHIKSIGFDDSTNAIVKGIMESEKVSYAHSVRILIRLANDTISRYPDIIEGYKDTYYGCQKESKKND